jgi:hypothetical protein
MDDLIEALTILRKYGNPRCPTNCTHDELMVCVDPGRVKLEDVQRLMELSFRVSSDGAFVSFRFGSC